MENNSMLKKAKIYEELDLLSVALGTKQDGRRLEMYAEDLETFDLKALVDCIRSFRASARYFPQLSEIIEKINGIDVATEDIANQVASDIISAISRFGLYQFKEAKEFLGEKYLIVERFGGWRSLCEIDNDGIMATRAQLRELAKSFVNQSKRNIKENAISEMYQIEPKSGLNKLDFSGVINEIEN